MASTIARRGFLGLASAAAVIGASGGLEAAWGSSDPLSAAISAPDYSPALVIGSGFGASVSALRLGQAGVRVTMLERGQRWQTSPWTEVFSPNFPPDQRASWMSGLPPLPFLQPPLPELPVQRYAGVLDSSFLAGGNPVLRGACVGGGSVVYFAALTVPQRQYFTQLYPSGVDYDSLVNVYMGRVRNMLGASELPADLYNSAPFTHSRIWDQQARAAGYQPTPLHSAFSWDVCRAELTGKARPSATIGEATYGNSNGVKLDLTQNYLPAAEATGNVTVYPLHQVTAIGRDSDGRYAVSVEVLDQYGTVTRQRTLYAGALFLGAGSIGSSSLLVRARDTGALPHLNDSVGQGWGTNGNMVTASLFNGGTGNTQATPLASGFYDETTGVPTAFVSGFIPTPLETTAIETITVAFDAEHRGAFSYDRSQDAVSLSYAAGNDDEMVATVQKVQQRVDAASASGLLRPVPLGVFGDYTAHPCGGACLGQATDLFGRVAGYDRLYVNDGALLPGNAGLAGPSLTIAALAERNMERIAAEDF
ncbi:MAG TPA: GMC oxidoreductase [Pseudonocardiaceae bacterium]|nr:GMC oxidoreductase [Pseudonocardiaceae bacterium]